MVTEIQHAKALNSAALPPILKRFVPFVALSLVGFAYAKHCDLHKKERTKIFYNRSKLFGGAKNPQY